MLYPHSGNETVPQGSPTTSMASNQYGITLDQSDKIVRETPFLLSGPVTMFAQNVYQTLADVPINRDSSINVSPFSIHSALTMTFYGSTTPTHMQPIHCIPKQRRKSRGIHDQDTVTGNPSEHNIRLRTHTRADTLLCRETMHGNLHGRAIIPRTHHRSDEKQNHEKKQG